MAYVSIHARYWLYVYSSSSHPREPLDEQAHHDPVAQVHNPERHHNRRDLGPERHYVFFAFFAAGFDFAAFAILAFWRSAVVFTLVSCV